jgi:pimeloyl-ACP methyl ester carboxylesterase
MKGSARSADGIPVHFEVEAGGAPALVFVHGWSCDRSYWSRQIDHFAGRHKVVAIDLAGHGESGAGRPEWTMPAFGADVAAVIEKLELRDLVLVGHSRGGDVIVEVALALPDRVAGLVWVDVYSTLGVSRTPEAIEEFTRPFRANFATATRAFVQRMFVPDSDPELVEQVVADMSDAPPEIAVGVMEHAVANDDAILAALRELRAPLVAINPDYRPTDVEALQRHGVKAVLMPGVGHFLMMEDPDTFNHLLDETIEEFTRRSVVRSWRG